MRVKPAEARADCGSGRWVDAEAGEDAEGEIKKADVEGGEGAQERARGDGEVGEEPEGCRGRCSLLVDG